MNRIRKQFIFKTEGRKFYRKVRHEFIQQSATIPCCFDCGCQINLDNGIIFLDFAGGMLFFCSTCTMTRITLKETWNKIIPIRGGNK